MMKGDVIMKAYVNEFSFFGKSESERKKDKAYMPPNSNKPYPGTKAQYDRACEDFNNNKRGKYNPVEYLYELHYFGYNEGLCIKIALANRVKMSEVFYGDEAPIKKASKFFEENGLGVLCDTDGFGYMYSPKTKKWYQYDHEETPQINPNRGVGFSAVMNSAKREYDEFMKDYDVNATTESYEYAAEVVQYSLYTKKYKNFNDFCKHMETPFDIKNWYLVNKVHWPKNENGSEGPFHWPDEIIKTSCGNCFDHALFMYFFCEKKGIKCKLVRCVAYFKSTDKREWWPSGHMVSMFKYNGGWYIFDPIDETKKGNIYPSKLIGPFKDENAACSYYKNHFQSVIKLVALNTGKEYTDTFLLVQDEKEMKYYTQYYNTKSIGRDAFVFKCCPSIVTKIDRNSSIPPKDIFEEIQRKGEDFINTVKNQMHKLIESYEFSMEATTPPEIHTGKLDLRKMTFIHASHKPGDPPTENSCLILNGKKYRVRVETLIYNEDGYILAAKINKQNSMGACYKVPGGSAERGKTLEQQAIAESQEEVRANVKDIHFTGIWYTNEFDDSDDKRLGDETRSWLEKVGLKYDGFITILFVGKYAGKYTGRVKEVDKVDWIKDVKFYDPKELNLIKPHQLALQKMWFNIDRISK